jgi:hypothetical protein
MRITIHFDSAAEHELRIICKAHRRDATPCPTPEWECGDGPKVYGMGTAWNGECAPLTLAGAIRFLKRVEAELDS